MESYAEQSKANFWGSTLEMIEEKPQPDPSQNGQLPHGPNGSPGTLPAPGTQYKPFNRTVAEAKARMGTAAIDLGLRCTLGPLGNYRMKKLYAKYIPEEKDRERAAELIIKQKPAATDDEDRNMRYMDKLLKKHNQLNDSIQLSEQQKKDMIRIISDYEEATGKSISPEIILYGGLAGIIGVKVYEVMTLDINIAASEMPTSTQMNG